MKHVLVLHAFDPERPTGLTRLVRRLCQHLMSLDCHVTLALPAIASDHVEFKQEWESFAENLGALAICWRDVEEFTPPQRERLVLSLERLHDQRPIDHVFAVGVTHCGFAAAIACQLIEVPLSVLVTYRDALCYHSLQPQEIETCVTQAFRVAATNPHVLHHVLAFHSVEDRTLLIDPRPNRKSVKTELASEGSISEDNEPYIVTTGRLDSSIHLRDLVDRIRSVASQEWLSVWRHVGTCCSTTKNRIENIMAKENTLSFVHDSQLIPRSLFAHTVSEASVHVIPQRETDTNSAAYESELWGVKTDYPNDHCFPKLRQRKQTIQFGKRTSRLSHIEQLAEDIAR